MEQEPAWAADDPEIAALLAFAPVARKNRRHDGWTPAHQRGFIAWLAVSGNVDKAAQAVGRTQSGAWTVRNSLGAEGFGEAWEAALALFHARRRAGKLEQLRAPPAGQRHTSRHAREVREAGAFRGEEPGLDPAETQEALDGILVLYLMKLRAERTARLEGRVIEADLCVRQLAWIEIILAIGGRAQELLESMKQGDRHLLQIVATPASNLLERARRAFWLEKGEADRPPPAPLGNRNEFYATGESSTYDGARDGDYSEWCRGQDEKRRLAAEAQQAWEARARAEAPVDPARLPPGPGNDNDEDPEPAA